jgi:hypothetical protein
MALHAMIEGKPSVMAEWAAMVRALHGRLDDRPLVFDDPLAERLLGPEMRRRLAPAGRRGPCDALRSGSPRHAALEETTAFRRRPR